MHFIICTCPVLRTLSLISCPSQGHYPSQTSFFLSFFNLVYAPFIYHLMNQPVLSIWTQISQKAFSETRLMEMPEQTNTQDQTSCQTQMNERVDLLEVLLIISKTSSIKRLKVKMNMSRDWWRFLSLSFQVQASVLGTMFTVWNTYILYPATWPYFRELTYHRQSLNRDIPQISIL